MIAMASAMMPRSLPPCLNVTARRQTPSRIAFTAKNPVLGSPGLGGFIVNSWLFTMLSVSFSTVSETTIGRSCLAWAGCDTSSGMASPESSIWKGTRAMVPILISAFVSADSMTSMVGCSELTVIDGSAWPARLGTSAVAAKPDPPRIVPSMLSML